MADGCCGQVGISSCQIAPCETVCLGKLIVAPSDDLHNRIQLDWVLVLMPVFSNMRSRARRCFTGQQKGLMTGKRCTPPR